MPDTPKGDPRSKTFTFTVEEPSRLLALTVTGDAPKELARLLAYIKSTAGVGHSFNIVVDPDDHEYNKSFGMDGDGADHITSLRLDGRKVEWDQKTEKLKGRKVEPWFERANKKASLRRVASDYCDNHACGSLYDPCISVGSFDWKHGLEDQIRWVQWAFYDSGCWVFSVNSCTDQSSFIATSDPGVAYLLSLIRGVTLEMGPTTEGLDPRSIPAADPSKINIYKRAAQVGTDTATVWAVAPEQLIHLTENPRFAEMLGDLAGNSEELEKLWRQHGGAVFHTGADGFWDVRVDGAVEEKGYTEPYGTERFVPRRLAGKWLRRRAGMR